MSYKRISPMPIVEGGTGAQTLTSNGVLLGNTTSAITATAAGTTGQVLTGVTGSAPTFQSPASSSISITGNTGGALTGTSFTFSGGTTGLSFGGSGSTETLTFAGITANGGTVSLSTDASSSTVNLGTGAATKTTALGSSSGTSTTAINSGAGLLSLTSNNGSITINSGAGTLGISTDSSATTVSIANSVSAAKTLNLGSGVSSSTTVIKSGSGNIAMNSGLTVDSTGRNKNAVQPCFYAFRSGNVNDVTGDATLYTVLFNSVAAPGFDQSSSFNTTTGTFTAPIAGKYFLSFNIAVAGLLVAHIDCQTQLVTTGNTYTPNIFNPFAMSSSGSVNFGYSVITSMAANDTAVVKFEVSGGTKVVDVLGSYSAFTGYLVC